jgi:hypothetical protein
MDDLENIKLVLQKSKDDFAKLQELYQQVSSIFTALFFSKPPMTHFPQNCFVDELNCTAKEEKRRTTAKHLPINN